MSYIDTKIVAITSQSATIKYNGSYLSNLRYNLGTIIQRDPDIIHRQVQLLNAQIPVSFYVINYTNNLFRLKLGAGALTNYTIPVGNYTANSLITAIKSTVNNVNFNIVISPINGRLTFSNTSTLQIDNTISSSIGFVLGFDNLVYNDTAFSLTAPYPLNLLGIKTLQIRSANLVMNNISSVQGGQTTLLGTIPVSAIPFGMIEYKDVGNNLITIYNDYLDDLDIEIVDGESDAYINFNNQDWCITLAFHITRRVESIAKGSDRNQSLTLPLGQEQILAKGSPNSSAGALESPGQARWDKNQSLTAGALESPTEIKEVKEEPIKEPEPQNPDLNDLDLLLG